MAGIRVCDMTTDDFQKMCHDIALHFQMSAPKDTGNLAYNAIKYEFVNLNECHIYVDEAIAPYMPYTNEPWISPRWKGKKNPNEKWWQETVSEAIEYMIAYYNAQPLQQEYITEIFND